MTFIMGTGNNEMDVSIVEIVLKYKAPRYSIMSSFNWDAIIVGVGVDLGAHVILKLHYLNNGTQWTWIVVNRSGTLTALYTAEPPLTFDSAEKAIENMLLHGDRVLQFSSVQRYGEWLKNSEWEKLEPADSPE